MKKLSIFIVLFLILACSGNRVKSGAQQAAGPQWAKEAVWYQIFPERFRNGDPSNDPRPEDMAGAWPYTVPEGWQIHPWTSDWYELKPWEQKTGHDFYWNHGLRRYGGDLQGVLDKLDYLQELGVTAIYFNPLFESPSLHKYDASMYHHIDNNFGPNPERDRKIWAKENPADPATWQWTSADSLFLQLIKEAHKRKMRIIIDGVFNHVGNTFWAFRDVMENQQNSAFKDWFYIKNWDDPATKENEFEYQGWYGIRDLPELREDENGLVAGPREHIRAIVQRWGDPDGDGDPSDGIDGWRLDVAEMVNITFWKDFRKWVKEVNPEAYLTGEIWWEDWPHNKMFNAAPWLQGDAFDAVMNYRFTRALRQFVANNKNKINAGAFADSLNNIYRDYSFERALVLQNLTGSHDMERIASQIVNPDKWIDHGGNPAQDPNFDVRKPDEEERQKQKLMAALQMTLPGAPMIYYGDEAGMWGGDDPDCRKPMVWPEFKYDAERAHPFGKPRPTDTVEFDTALYDWYKKWIRLRRNNRTLSMGAINFIPANQEVLVFERILEKDTIHVAANSSNKPTSIQPNVLNRLGDKLINMISEETIFVKKNGLELAPYEIFTLRRKK
ncbi:MAG TPA: alpha-amylase [Caldithrix abyssi]|uniref:Alpha-amylase n=1 Tax=Caldithrix abyssi TaxID=187145 RepID=A0A7V4WW64_CALAY|nr:alpha-amylase [Caldithrix abyssi]